MKLMVHKDKAGRPLYAVCSFEDNQHKLYNAHDRLFCASLDGEDCSDELEKVEHALEVFDNYVFGGVVYATKEDREIILNYTTAYDVRHDVAGDWRCDI